MTATTAITSEDQTDPMMFEHACKRCGKEIMAISDPECCNCRYNVPPTIDGWWPEPSDRHDLVNYLRLPMGRRLRSLES